MGRQPPTTHHSNTRWRKMMVGLFLTGEREGLQETHTCERQTDGRTDGHKRWETAEKTDGREAEISSVSALVSSVEEGWRETGETLSFPLFFSPSPYLCFYLSPLCLSPSLSHSLSPSSSSSISFPLCLSNLFSTLPLSIHLSISLSISHSLSPSVASLLQVLTV